MKIRHQQDFFSGLLFLGFGVAGLILSRSYQMGSAAQMGPGYFPFVLSGLLWILGLIVMAQALTTKRSGGDIEKGSFKVVGLIMGSIVVFALLLQYLGLVAAIIGVILTSALESDEFSWKTTIISAVVLAITSVALFVWGLKLQFQIWPAFIAH